MEGRDVNIHIVYEDTWQNRQANYQVIEIPKAKQDRHIICDDEDDDEDGIQNHEEDQ